MFLPDGGAQPFEGYLAIGAANCLVSESARGFGAWLIVTDHGCVCCCYIQITIRLIISHYLNLNSRNWIAVIDAPATAENGDRAINYVSQLKKIEKTQPLLMRSLFHRGVP